MRLLHRLQRQSGRNCTKRPCAGSTFATKTHKIRIILHMDTKPWKTQSLEHTLWTDSGRARAPSLPPLRLKGLATARATKQRRLEPDLHPVHTWASSRAPTGAPGHRPGSGAQEPVRHPEPDTYRDTAPTAVRRARGPIGSSLGTVTQQAWHKQRQRTPPTPGAEASQAFVDGP
jgi:hypothetical protein